MTTAQAITNGFISTHLCVLYNKKQSIFNGSAARRGHVACTRARRRRVPATRRRRS